MPPCRTKYSPTTVKSRDLLLSYLDPFDIRIITTQVNLSFFILVWRANFGSDCISSWLSLKPQAHIHDFGHGRAKIHPDLSNCDAIDMIRSSTVDIGVNSSSTVVIHEESW